MIIAGTAAELAEWIEQRLRSMGSNADALAGTSLKDASRAQVEMILEALRLLASKKS